MTNKKNNCHLPFLFMLCIVMIPGMTDGQDTGGLKHFSDKYPNNSVILTSYKEDLVIRMIDGKPELDISEYKELLALNDNAAFFAESGARFGSVYKFKDIEAYSLVPDNGTYKKIPVKNFNKTTETSDGLFFDDVISYNFTFPSVIKGSKMITRIRRTSDDPVFAYRFFFGDYFPCDEYRFTLTCPENVEIKYKVYGRDTSIINFSTLVKGGKKIYTWCASNPKSYINDDQAPDGAYYMPHIVVQIAGYSYKGNSTAVISSLDDLYKIVYKRISSINLSESKEIKVLTDSLTAGAESNIDRVGKIFSWVQKNIKYVAFEDGANGYIPREATLVLQRKYGDCKDKTSLLVAMMRSQGLNASFAWVGSREIPYRFTEFPTEFDSNHMIAIWWDDNDNPVVLDGTTLHNRLEDVPSFIQGKECLIERGLADYRVFTIPVASPERNTVYDSLTVELKGDTLTGIGSAYITGEKRPYMIESFDGKEPADLPATINKQMPKASNKFIIESVDPVETESGGQIFKYNYKFYLPDYLSEYNNVSYLNLNLDRFPNNVNIKEDRWTPMELNYTTQHVFVCTFIIPDGYEARDIPKDSSYENSLFSYKQSYTVTGREIKVKTIVTLNFQVIENNEVSQFREMLSQLNSYYNKTIPIYKTVTK